MEPSSINIIVDFFSENCTDVVMIIVEGVVIYVIRMVVVGLVGMAAVDLCW